MNVIESCEAKLEPSIKQLLVSLMSGDSKPLNNQINYHEVICDLYQCAPQILSGVIPYLTGELLVMHDLLLVRVLYILLFLLETCCTYINSFKCSIFCDACSSSYFSLWFWNVWIHCTYRGTCTLPLFNSLKKELSVE